jgi:type I restriction enzyme M protein
LKANRTGKKIEDPIFKKNQNKLRWSKFKDLEAENMFNLVKDDVFEFIKNMGKEDGSTFSQYMENAIFMIPTPNLLEKVVSLIQDIPMDDKDTKGDLYEYLLSKIASAGTNGQFRTPRHIIQMIVELVQPTPEDIISDPACGTAGFLVASAEYILEHHPEVLRDKKLKKHFLNKMFHGNDFDASMLRIGAMNLMLHGLENPVITRIDSLSEKNSAEKDKYSLILANPPFKGSLDYDTTANNLLQVVKTKKTELLFLALMVRELKVGGRCAVIIPDGVLFGSSKAHKTVRQEIVENQKLEAVISMPSGVFKPYAGVSTAILIFTKTNSGGTDNVWFYDMKADGYSLDDKRAPLDKKNHEDNNIPDIIKRYHNRKKENKRERMEQSFMVPTDEIREASFDLSISTYKEHCYDEISFKAPKDLLLEINSLEKEIASSVKGLSELIL